MQHEDCSNWDYAKHPAIQTVVAAGSLILNEMRVAPATHQAGLSDTRYLHGRIFSQTAPVKCPEVAGNYRGSNFPCLVAYAVRFGGHLGTPPASVSLLMDDFHAGVADALKTLDDIQAKGIADKDKKIFLLKIVAIAAATMARFFTIHPYMNGNGHMGRLMVWILLIRYGYVPVSWTVHKSPPGYDQLLDLYRAGKTKPLEAFILRNIIS